MADEIQVSLQVTVENGNDKYTFRPGAQKLDQAAVGRYESIQNIGTSEESITSFGDISGANQGICIVQNLDNTNFVELGFATTNYPIKVSNNDIHTFRFNGDVDLYLKADTAACNVRIIVLEA